MNLPRHARRDELASDAALLSDTDRAPADDSSLSDDAPPAGDHGPGTAEATVGPRALGRFRILRKLERGDWGAAYLAWDPLLRRNVALKVPHPEAAGGEEQRRFLREAEAAGRLDHPGVVRVFEVDDAGPAPRLVSA